MSKNDPAERTVRDIRRKTRKQYTAEEKIRIVVSGLRGEESICETLLVASFACIGGLLWLRQENGNSLRLHRKNGVVPTRLERTVQCSERHLDQRFRQIYGSYNRYDGQGD